MKTRSFRVFAFACLGTILLLTGCGSGSSSTSTTPTSPTAPTTPTVVAPTITSLTPATVAAGAGNTTLTVTGTGFDSTTAVQVGEAVEVTTFVSSTNVTAAIPAAQLATGALLPVIALNGTSSSASGAAVNLEVDNPAPTISQTLPSAFVVGSPPVSVSVTGTGFVSTTVIDAGGSARPTTYVSPTEVSVLLTAADLATAGNLALTAVNPAPGGGTSQATAIAINSPNPVPGSIAVSPNTIVAGASTPATVTITGTNFLSTSSVLIGGSPRATTYVSATQLAFQLSVTDQATAGILSVSVANPAPGGGTSPAVFLTINNPQPGQLTLSPTAVILGTTTPTTITVNGTNFVQASTIYVGNTPTATTFVSPTQLTFQLSVAQQATAAELYITVVNPGPGGGESYTTLTVAPPAQTPVLTSVTPTQFIVGSTGNQINVAGTNFTQTSVIQWNGTPISATSFGYAGSQLAAIVPDALVAAMGTASVTVNNPTATPGTSNAISVSIVNPPPPTLASLSPASGPINTDTSITLSGTGFTAASTVSFNGSNLTATFVNSTALTVTLPAANIALPGNYNFTVTTPAPGGGTTAALVYTAYVGIVNNSMVYDPATGLFYLSVPSSVGAPYGNSVVSIDPATGALGTPILVGSEPDQLAITSDGKYLWVGLDGASAVVQVDLTTNTAGTPFSLGGNAGLYANPATALSLAALPGAPNSVVVSSSNASSGLAIYDSGVIRGTLSSTYPFNSAYALQVDGTRSEVYAGAQSTYNTYTYSASGLTSLASASNGSYAAYNADEMQVAGGVLYTDFGTAYDAESGALLGTFYSSGNTAATGTTTADTTLGSVFILENASSYYNSGPTQIQVFNASSYAVAGTSAIPVSISINNTSNVGASRLTRWGTNGLAFRTGTGFYSLRSNLVKDLSSVSADLGVTLAASSSTATGASTTYTATVTNAGPVNSTNVALSAQIPSTGVLVSATPSTGSCATSNGVACDLGGIANGSSVTVTFVVNQLTPGSATMTVQVSGSESDPNLANNQATSTSTITGSAYSPVPAITSISPATVLAGSTDTTIMVTGSGFTSSSSILLNGTPLATTAGTVDTQLTATVPAASLTTLGWSAISVSNPAPGGGTSQALPLSVFSVITLGVNHIVYDPYSGNIMASVGSGSSTVTGNSIVAITPETSTVGTPVPIGSQPTNLALTSDGQVLYTILSGSQSVALFNMLTQQAEYTYAVPSNSSFDGGIALRGISAQPGTENTIALDLAAFTGNAIYDFDPANQTAAIRGQASGPYSGSCIKFLDADDLLAFDTDTSGATLDHYTVTSAGFTYYDYSQYGESTLNDFGCFQLSGGLAFANAGGVANPATQPATQLGVFSGLPGGEFSSLQDVAPDTSLQQVFFLTTTENASAANAIAAYNPSTFLLESITPIDIPTVEGDTSYTIVDFIRWGQDGLAALTSGGHIYLLRGAAVVPQLLNQNIAATLTSSSATTIVHGTGNTLLTLTGSNFVPGVAVTWNGSYRTTTILDATDVTVAIPASDLASAGTASLVATNPGASGSSALTITIN